MIKCLSKEVQEKLRSGVTLPSLQQCVEELILNSIDAGSTCVGVRVDMDAFKVQVIDNGRGMSAEDIDCVGTRYYTSKCNSVEDLEDLKFYGFRGEALASVVSLATLVEISSRTKTSVKTHVKIYREGKGLDVFEAETSRPSAGTTVIVCNYFYNMPVRRKRLDAVLENERIRQRVEAISLLHPSVSFTLKNDCTGAMVVQLPKARDTYYRFVQIYGLARAQKLGQISFSRGQFEVTGYIGKEGHYNKSLQFLFVNERLLLRTQIHKFISGLLRKLSSSNHKNESPEVNASTRSPKHKRCQDLYCVYVINIKCPHSEYDVCLEPAKTLIEFKDWDGVLSCIDEAVKEFLNRENLVAEVSQDDTEIGSPKKDFNNSSHTNTDADTGQCVSTSHYPKADSAIEMALSSKSVYRSHTNSSVHGQDTKDNEEEQNISKCFSKNMNDAKQNSENVESEHLNVQPESKEVSKETSSNILAEKLQNKLPEPPEENTSYQTENKVKTDFCSNNYVPSVNKKQTFVNTKKVFLSDPYVHKSLESKHHCKNSEFQLKETLFAPKRKISLEAGQSTAWKDALEESAPAKIRKIVSLSSVSQSLDQFRRTFDKPNPIFPIKSFTDHSFSQRQNIEKCQQECVVTNLTEEDKHKLLSPPTLKAFTKIRPVTLNRNKKSLANKLCFLRQQNEKGTSVPSAETSSQADHDITSDCIQENEPESTHSSDKTKEEQKNILEEWLPLYDSSVGKTVYVNKVTGLSRFEEPSTGQADIRCTSDITNMAVSVMSEAGEDSDNSNSLHSMYSKWSNPVYIKPPEVCVDISRGQTGGLSVKVHNILFPYQFTKNMIPTMKVINQVDKKFLACLLDTRENKADSAGKSGGNLLVLVDQHAAHERIRLENLIADAYEDDLDALGEKRLSYSIISPPLEIYIPQEDQRLLRSCGAHLQILGLDLSFSEEHSQVFVGKVPRCFTEKDINERRRGRPSVVKPLVEEYLREQIELLHSAGRLRATLPLTVQKVLASFACRGAIKFNTLLSKDECFSLVTSLSGCQLPFQCAHGRPSIVPIVDFHHIDKEEKDTQRPNLSKLKRMYKAWQLFGNR